MNPVLIGVPDNGLGGGTNYQLFLKLSSGIDHHAAIGSLQTVVCYYGALLGEALHVFSLTAQERFGNQQGEVGVLSTCLLEHLVQLLLHLLPNGVAIGFDDHTSTYGRLLCQVGFNYQIVIPLTVVVSSFCQIF